MSEKAKGPSVLSCSVTDVVRQSRTKMGPAIGEEGIYLSLPIFVSLGGTLSVATLVLVSDKEHLGCSKVFISLIYHIALVRQGRG